MPIVALPTRQEQDEKILAGLVREILSQIGEDPGREGLLRTPLRVARSLLELTSGYQADLDAIINGALFEVEYNEMVLVKDITFYSLCVPSKQIVNAVSGAKPARSIRTGDRLWTLDRGYLKQTTVTRVTSRKTRRMVKVLTSEGSLRVTPDHPIMTPVGWQEAQNLKHGDRVEWINPKSLCRAPRPPRPGYPLGYVMGATAADGSVQDGRRISLVVGKETFAEKFRDMFAQAFPPLNPVVERVQVPSSFLKKEVPMYRVRVVSRDIGEKICRWFGIRENGSRSKTRSFQFPKVVTSSKTMMQGFLDGYCDGDGYSYGSGRFIISSNKKFLQGLADYLQTPVATIDKKRECFRIYVSNRWDQNGWYKKHGFRQQSEFYAPVESTYAEVAEVRRVPEAKKPYTVYSFQCEPYPSFLIGGHLTHNCEHHILPFFGKAHVAYIPDRRVIGLSKIPKLVHAFARRLQVQERMTRQVADILLSKLEPLGVGVVIEARHLCMEMRGARSIESSTVTSAMLGIFQKDKRTREEFLSLIRASTQIPNFGSEIRNLGP